MNDIKEENKDLKIENPEDIQETQLNIENIENSKAEYLLELETPIGETLKTKLEKIKELKKKGSDLYKAKFETNTDAKTIHEKYSSIEAGGKAEGQFSIAGRIMIFSCLLYTSD